MIELTKAYSNAEQEISKNTTWNVLGMHAYNIHESMFSSTIYDRALAILSYVRTAEDVCVLKLSLALICH